MNYTWQIARIGLKDQMNHEGQLLQDAIVHVVWKKTGQDADGAKASYVGETEFSAAEVSSADFINLNLIAKDDVVGWIENSLSQREKTNIDNIIQKKIDKSKLRYTNPSWG